ncbi:type I restriction-modification system subunit M [Nodosilinea sp. AN01ver1]|uniref:type I restriction-modification system subunit M n=1 Tax=Nodosilinea sp. AN01ver1 TaxID=3423362 RepID=UPI003D317250
MTTTVSTSDPKAAKKIRQEEIQGVLWAACDTFRGVVDPSEYKNYILVMLFLKYISDIWRDKYAQYAKEFEGDDRRIQRRMERERFVLPAGASFYDLYEQRGADNIGELINIALEAIEEHPQNKAKLDGVFRNIDFNSEANLGKTKDRNRRLKNLLEDFNKPVMDLSPSRVDGDIIGNAYIYLIERFASGAGKKAGEFFTPAQVSKLVAKLAQPKPGDRICDPACGSGSLLVYVANEVESDNCSLYGQEVNGSTWALARMNMFLHGKDGARIEWSDTLNSPALVELDDLMRFNVVVANPPFSLDKWGAEEAAEDRFNRFWRGVPPKTKGDFAFITHMIETALPREGRVAVIVPHGVLFRGSSEGRIRQTLIEENLLDAVIGLPPNLFPSTSIPVAVLVFDRGREGGGAHAARRDVMFIDASREFQPGKNQNTLLDKHIEHIVDTYLARQDEDKYAHAAPIEEIEENDYNLNIPRYVDTFEEEEEIDIAAVQKEIESLEGQLAQVRSKMVGYLQRLGVEVGTGGDA